MLTFILHDHGQGRAIIIIITIKTTITTVMVEYTNKLLYLSLCFKNDAEMINTKSQLDPVGSTVRYEMMKLCTGSL